jgi:MoaA/NifB/PqqE/SkfB family radical SAM enzyme|tara:strand:+ start:6236 stop:7411 length:1176 start_codon:yes stop_codon:yes gene_type:complete
MKNVFLSNFQRSDALFPIVAGLPAFVRNVLIDTYVPAATRLIEKRAFVDRLTVFLTDQCNLRCEHCFIVKGQPKSWEMGLEEYRKLFSSFKGRISQVLLTGGEPTLRSDFAEILVMASSVGGVSTVNTFTNGLKPHRVVEALGRAIRETPLKLNIQTSIDGLPAFHDAHRRVDGALDKAMEMVDAVGALQARHPDRIGRIVATTAISKRTLDDLPAIIALTRDTAALPGFTFVRGVSDGVFNLQDPDDISAFEPDDYEYYLNPDEMLRALKIIDRELWRHHPDSLFFSYNRTNLEAIATSLKTGVGQVSCKMGFVDLVILQNGDVARCEMLKSFANLRDYDWDLEKVMASDAYRGFMARTPNCWCTHDCGVGVSLMYENRLIKRLFERANT